MTSKKTRHEFLADAAITAKLNALVQSGATKTDIIVQAIKAFAERDDESEFSCFTAKRFDTLSHEIEAVRQSLEAVRRDLESARQDRMEMESDVKTILENVTLIYSRATAKMPPPSEELRPSSHGFLGIFR
jgi:hypothetical protein